MLPIPPESPKCDQSPPTAKRPGAAPNVFGGLALALGAFCWLAFDSMQQVRGTEGQVAWLEESAFWGIVAAIGLGLGLHAVRNPGGRLWFKWAALLVNASLVLVVVLRLVRWL